MVRAAGSGHSKSVSYLGDLFRSGHRAYKKKQIILHQDDVLSFIYSIKTGYVKVYTILSSGNSRTLFLLGPNDIFPSASSLLSSDKGHHLKHYYEALTDITVNYMNYDDFFESLHSDGQAMQLLLNYLNESNAMLTKRLEAAETKSALDRVANILPYLAEKCGRLVDKGTYRLMPALVHQEIADLAGVTRETASVQIKQLETEGAIKQQKGRWLIYIDQLQPHLEIAAPGM